MIGLLAVSGLWSSIGLVEMATAPAEADITTTPPELGRRVQKVLGVGPPGQQAFARLFGLALVVPWLVSGIEDAAFEATHGAPVSMAVPPRPDLW
ncbi:MAG: hypothetical protein ABI572_01555 [Actinomycetota bacterium]